MPAIATTVVAPESAPPPGFTLIAIVTSPVNDVTVAPARSITRTETAGPIGEPACVFVGD